jgi:tetratricopeptide (TPR) repeat protein
MDVHPPQHAITTWRDFFIHIATIVVGLLIAIGLEQTVEWLHHVHQIREIRHTLSDELTANVTSFHRNVSYVRHDRAMLQNDLRIFQYLQQHPATSPDKLPGVVVWSGALSLTTRSAWDAAQQTDALGLMPKPEVETSRLIYDQLQKSDAIYEAFSNAIDKADAYQFLTPDVSKLTPAQINAEIPLIQDCLSLSYRQTIQLNNIARLFPEFAPGPAQDEVDTFHNALADNSQQLQQAHAYTQHDNDAAAALDATQAPSIEFNRLVNQHGPIHINQVYDQFLKTHPNFKPDESSLNRRGYAHIYQRDFPSAIEVFRLNVRLYPNSWNAYDSLGEAYAKNGQTQLAIENYQKSIQLNPSNANGIQHLKELQNK